ncbi:protein kinase [Spongisporangium articulatum]|uniref:Protein kinase n=1 Tax=Spongisporangium articulatum TaxID=3362603 RepID=A0ABW8AT58_9ACTN
MERGERLEEYDPRRLGRFTVMARLGSGSMGRVFLAESERGELVAIKLVHEGLASDPQFRKRFAREVEAARRVGGSSTVRVLDADVDAARPWMATEYVDGPTVLASVEADGPLVDARLREVVAAIADALVDIHAADVIHRDLKPSNVVLGPDGPRVIDFGIARASEASTMTGTGHISGSAGFMSPEQALGRSVTPATDVFSLAALAYFAATGRPVFGTGTVAALVFRVVHDDPDLSGLDDAGLVDLFGACLAKDPEARPTPAEVAAVVRGEQELPTRLGTVPARPVNDAPTVHAARPPEPLAAQPISAAPSSRPARRALALVGVGAAVILVAAATLVGVRLLGEPAGATADKAAGPGPSTAPRSTTLPGALTTSQPTTSTSSAPSSTAGSTGSSGSAGATAVSVPAGGSGSKPQSGGGTNTGQSSSGGSTTRSTTPARQASVGLDVPGSLTAKAYFGRLDAVMATLDAQVTFLVNPSFEAAHGDQCVLTVVFKKAVGDQGAVYAQNLGSGWTGAENQPDQNVSTDDGVMHQQLIVPPVGTGAGASWQGSAFLRLDGVDHESSSYSLRLSSGSGSRATWKFAGQSVRCTVP